MQKDVAWYISKGFERPWAEYYAQGRQHAIHVVPLPHHVIEILFENGQVVHYDCTHLIEPQTVFSPLENDEVFKRVRITEEGSIGWDIDPNIDSSAHWSNLVDISADTCYVEGTKLPPEAA